MNEGVQVTTRNYRGDEFREFYARRDPGTAPGWFIFGRNPAYGGRYIMLCARPDVTPRRHPHYNCKVQRGWHTQREAQAIADWLNRENVTVS
jgi:hypothetical protein